jgi:hypothetical protein
MSTSEKAARLSALVAQLSERIEETVKAGEVADVPRPDVTALVSGAVKLYATSAEEAESDVPVIDATVSTTEAMVRSTARAPFEPVRSGAMVFSHGRRQPLKHFDKRTNW